MTSETYSDFDVAAVIALMTLPGVGPARLRALIDSWGASEAWRRVCAGTAVRHPAVDASLKGKSADLSADWRIAAASTDPIALLDKHSAAGIRIVARNTPEYPAALLDDPAPSEVLFVVGNASLLTRPRVAIVGTRRCTRYGHDVARRFGAELAEAGVAVISGLAIGVDGAAHQGVHDSQNPGSAIGVVGSGLDIVYPTRNRDLWLRVANSGLLLSESPLGVGPETWRFPARNRIIAGLSQIVVVVESRETGGSLLTVDEAAIRGREVLAVPGPITAPASRGTNRLIADGARPILETQDILDSLGFPSTESVTRAAKPFTNPELFEGNDELRVLIELSAAPMTLDELIVATGLSLDRLALVVTTLEMRGSVTRSHGYLERVHL